MILLHDMHDASVGDRASALSRAGFAPAETAIMHDAGFYTASSYTLHVRPVGVAASGPAEVSRRRSAPARLLSRPAVAWGGGNHRDCSRYSASASAERRRRAELT
jgi:hypothetical protein